MKDFKRIKKKQPKKTKKEIEDFMKKHNVNKPEKEYIIDLHFSNQMQIIAFLKNIGLAGGMLFLIINGPKGFCLDKDKKYVRL